ncbi:Asparaginase/glutaminase (plasmid) [Gemmatirosa kalamazoonensis]|uniref:Asparaginase/glutaminase n=1 Tax=Gemmatirosa kalamazoonensis TaxID=861299 RepID=W0RTK5_9BACT|nr:asparaginase [Gemmatirosa kalamazoonensis]AHG93645.1 Asparaginase/glutaminase [Gemmatirosa kalamazoonensis]
MRLRFHSTLALTLLGAASPLPAQRPRPHVHLVATGGTIASTNYYSGQSGKIGVEALLEAVPALDTVATITAQQFANVASTSITPAMWLALSRGIADTLRAHPDLAGVVVTHGTDTLEETAYFLDLTVADPRPVVVTGAMRPSDGVGIDGPANLLAAVRIAASPASRGRGTMVVLNDEIMAARDATKLNTVRPDAFAAPYRGDLGVADPERVVFHREPHRAPTFDLAGVSELPRVDVVYAYVGADGAAVDAFVAAGAKGLVVAGAGRGGTPSAMRQAIDRAMANGVVVVDGSRVGSGSVPVGEGVSRRGSGPAMVGTGDLNVQHARVLLMLALTKTTDAREVARMFAEHQ